MADKPTTAVQKAQQIMQEFTNQQRNGMNEFIKEVSDALNADDPDIKKIPVNVFESVFKPYLLGAKESTNDENYIAHWAGLVGPTSPAEVVDIQGNKLFTVPPLYDSSLINTAERKRSVSGILQNFERDVSVNPGGAIQEFAVGVANTIEQTVSKEEKYSWDEMLNYYNKTNPPIDVKSVNVSAVSDDFTFDE